MRHLRCDGHAAWEIGARNGVIVAALVAAPIEQAIRHAHAAIELRAMIAIAWNEHVAFRHRRRDADANRFLAERGGECAQLPRSLQGDSLAVEGARARHFPVELEKQLHILPVIF
jgi:hypothetical protein